MPTFPLQTNFTAGVFSPRLDGRVDITRYQNALKTCRNWLIFPHGGVSRRPGSHFVVETKTSSKKSRVMPFEFSDVQAYILEFGDSYVRFFKDSGRIESPVGTAVEVATPYLEADLTTLNYAQSADVLYLAHAKYAPRKLTRTSHTAWTLTTIDFIDGPYLEEDTVITITPSAVSGAGITLTASAALFESGHVNALFRLKHDLKPGTPTVTPQGAAGSTAYSYRITGLNADGQSLASTAGTTSTGNATLDATNFNRVTWTPLPGAVSYRVYGRKANVELFLAEVQATTYDDIAAFTPNGALPTKDTSGGTWGYAKVTAFTSSTVVTADVKTAFGRAAASTAYREGAWSTKRGFPRAVIFHEQRLAWAATDNQPQTLWLSESAAYETHTPGSKDNNAIVYTIASNDVNVIRWVVSTGKALLVGTLGGEFNVLGTKDGPLTPSNIAATPETSFGGSVVMPVRVGGPTLFVQRSGRKLRELVFDFNSDAYRARDLSQLTESLFPRKVSITYMDYQKDEDPILWCVRSDGVLLGMTYDRLQDVVGWHEHKTEAGAASFESVAVIPHPDLDVDQVWLTVKRTINGATKRYVEYLDSKGNPYTEYEQFNTDSGLSYDGTKATTLVLGAVSGNGVTFTAGVSTFVAGDVDKEIRELGGPGRALITAYTSGTVVTCDIKNAFSSTSLAASAWGIAVFSVTGLAHLDAKKVSIVGDGAVYNDATVASAAVTLAPVNSAVRIEVGLGYESVLETMRPEVLMPSGGTSQGRKKHWASVLVRIYKTLGVTIEGDAVPFRRASDKMDVPPPLKSDDVIVSNLGWSRDGRITIKQTQPLPATILAISGTIEVGGG